MKQMPAFGRLYLIMNAMRNSPCEFLREFTINDTEMISVKTTTLFDNSQKVLEVDLAKSKKPGHLTVSFRVKHPVSNMCYDSGWCDDLDEEKMSRVKDFLTQVISQSIKEF